MSSGPSLQAGDIPITRIYADAEADLALCQAKAPICSAGLNLAVSWQMPEIWAYGFAKESPYKMGREGPIVPKREGSVDDETTHLGAHFGLPKGFSGGPWIAQWNRIFHVIGISKLGGDTQATTRAIAAEHCIAFLQRVRNQFDLGEISWKTTDPVLESCGNELAHWVQQQKQEFGRHLRDPSFLWNIHPRIVNGPNQFVWLERTTQEALAAFGSGLLPQRICFFIDAERLLKFIEGRWTRDALSALTLFICQDVNKAEASPMSGLVQRLIVEGRVCWLLFGSQQVFSRNVFDHQDINRLFADLDRAWRGKKAARRKHL